MATTFKDYYQTLDVPRTATQKDIKAAFRKLARKHHPDVNPGDTGAEDRFKEVSEANEVLSDPEKRRRYDELGSRWREYEAWEQAGRPGTGPMGGRPEPGYRSVSPEDLEDLFGGDEAFSDFFHEMFGRAGTRHTPRPRRGDDLEGAAEITLEEAATGTLRTIEISDPGGARRIEVRIPAGVSSGARVRAQGQGIPGTEGGGPGDLFVRVHVRPHDRLRRDGDDVHTRVPVPLDIAILGGEVTVSTPTGTAVSLSIPPGSQNGSRLRLRGQGMPRLRGGPRGDLIAEIDVRLPTPVTEEVRALAEAARRQRETADVA